jgi:hypothetical protein
MPRIWMSICGLHKRTDTDMDVTENIRGYPVWHYPATPLLALYSIQPFGYQSPSFGTVGGSRG